MNGRLMVPAAKAMKDSSGAGAVQLSMQQNRMKENAQVTASDDRDEKDQIVLRNTQQNQFIANKNFVNNNGVWIDSDYTDASRLPVVEVKFGSDEYFRLAMSDPQLAQYLSLGRQVTVVWKGKVYKVTS